MITGTFWRVTCMFSGIFRGITVTLQCLFIYYYYYFFFFGGGGGLLMYHKSPNNYKPNIFFQRAF